MREHGKGREARMQVCPVTFRQPGRKTQALVVGAGITGAYTAYLLKKAGVHHVVVWEKGPEVGGRMRQIEGVDGGAQYLTRADFLHSKLVYSDLAEKGILRLFDITKIDGSNRFSAPGDRKEHYMAPKGLHSICRYFLTKADAVVRNQPLESLRFMKYDLLLNDQVEDADIVVLTMPVPDFMEVEIEGIMERDALKDSLKRVQYSERWVMIVQCHLPDELPWVAKYFDEGDIRYISNDGAKRGSMSSALGCPTKLLVHSSVPFALKSSNTLSSVRCALLKDLSLKLPSVEVLDTTLYKWVPSQVHKPFFDQSRKEAMSGCLQLSTDASPAVVLTGDAFGPAPTFDGCIEAARRTVEHITLMRQQHIFAKA